MGFYTIFIKKGKNIMENRSNYILKELCNNGYESYIVGGYVRDLFLDKNSTDIDITTSAKPKNIKSIFRENKLKFIGKSFNIVLVDNIEVATFRKDVYHGLSDKNVEITFAKTIIEDLKRRDLTINSMAYCTFTGEVIDPFNGIKDLKNKIIRFNGKPEDRIKEDPNRIIRACRFKALIGGEFEQETKNALIEYAHLVSEFVNSERIRIEILKAMNIQKASLFFKALREINALQYIFPSLDTVFDYDDPYLHGPYHDESIIDHCLMCGDVLPTRNKLLKLTGYLHDIGKPLSCRYNNDKKRFVFYDHEKYGKECALKELRKLKFSNLEVHYISNLIRLHMRIFHTEKSIRKILFHLINIKINWKHLYQLKLADNKSNMKSNVKSKNTIQRECLMIFDEIYKKKNIFSNLNLSTKDIMDIKGIEPSKFVGKIKGFLIKMIIEHPELNNKENLTQLVEEYEL